MIKKNFIRTQMVYKKFCLKWACMYAIFGYMFLNSSTMVSQPFSHDLDGNFVLGYFIHD